MKIQAVQVERFGAWRDLDLPLSAHGMTVLYGPNETGKSTLLRFMRGVLYGFHPRDEVGLGARPGRTSCAGQLLVEHAGAPYTLRRESQPGGRGRLRVTGSGGLLDADETLARLCSGVSEDVFEHVFAIGLPELQELATLAGDEVARHVYDVSLGRDGERVVSACARAQAERSRLIGTAPDGAIVELRRRLADLDAQIAARAARAEETARLALDCERLQAEIDDQQQRQRGLQSQLRGHQFLERVAGPWRRQQQLLGERDALPRVADFPEDGIAQLDRIELEQQRVARQRRELGHEITRQRKQAAAAQAAAKILGHADAVQELTSQSAAVRAMESRWPAQRQQLQSVRRDLDERLGRLGPGWNEARLHKLDPSPAATARLYETAHLYRAAWRARLRCIQRYQRGTSALQLLQSRHTAARPGDAAGNLAQARADLLREIQSLEQLSSGDARVAALREKVAALQELFSAVRQPAALPRYFYAVLWLFAAVGAVLMAVGIRRLLGAGIEPTHWIVGSIFLLLGICCGGLTWTMKRQFDPVNDDRHRLQLRLDAAEDELRDAQRDIRRISQDRRPHSSDGEQRLPLPERLLAARRGLSELDALTHSTGELAARRGKLSALRERIRERQRDVSRSRRDWCEALKSAGLDESIRVRGPLAAWAQALEARDLLEQLLASQAALARDEAGAQEFRDRIAQLAGPLGAEEPPAGRPHDTLAAWHRALQTAREARRDRARLRRDTRLKQHAWLRLSGRLLRLRGESQKLLSRVGASSRDEFVSLYRSSLRRAELDSQLAALHEELATAAATEPELAVVEEDLRAFDPLANRQAIETIRRELTDLESDSRAAHELLGRVQQERRAREADRTEITLRFDRAQCATELEEAVRQLAAVELAEHALDALRSRLERDQQPQLLERAGRSLMRLTLGNYSRIWAPLGERRLVIDDEQGQAFGVEQLSNGTREQLLLAIRLALIEGLHEGGCELPVVLDDVFVNFDEVRTEAAVATLADFASAGRQTLMFTCHRHLVRLFEQRGVPILRLPDRAADAPQRRVG